MYTRSFIRNGDRTTRAGIVEARPNGATVGEPEQNISFDGDPVHCPACNFTGKTRCVLPYYPWTGHDGRQANLDGDLCLCKCLPPPRLKASGNELVMTFEEIQLAAVQGAEGWLAYIGQQRRSERWISFQVGSEGLYTGIRCTATMDDGSVLSGVFDEANTVSFHSASGMRCAGLNYSLTETELKVEDSVALSLMRRIMEARDE